jgi:hypothetical protein
MQNVQPLQQQYNSQYVQTSPQQIAQYVQSQPPQNIQYAQVQQHRQQQQAIQYIQPAQQPQYAVNNPHGQYVQGPQPQQTVVNPQIQQQTYDVAKTRQQGYMVNNQPVYVSGTAQQQLYTANTAQLQPHQPQQPQQIQTAPQQAQTGTATATSTASTTGEKGIGSSISQFWDKQSSGKKTAIGIGGALLAGFVGYEAVEAVEGQPNLITPLGKLFKHTVGHKTRPAHYAAHAGSALGGGGGGGGGGGSNTYADSLVANNAA